VDLVLDSVDAELAISIEISTCRAAQAEVDLLTFSELPSSFQARVEREEIAVHGQRA
jgi:hypothetical protein